MRVPSYLDWKFDFNRSDLGFIRIARLGMTRINFGFGLKVKNQSESDQTKLNRLSF